MIEVIRKRNTTKCPICAINNSDTRIKIEYAGLSDIHFAMCEDCRKELYDKLK